MSVPSTGLFAAEPWLEADEDVRRCRCGGSEQSEEQDDHGRTHLRYNAAMSASPQSLPTFEDVMAAARRLAGVAVATPFVESPALSERVRGRVFLKLETLQRTGSFKFRGAYNRLVQLSPAERRLGVVAFSSGNHAQGIAAAAALLGIPATIVMPADAPRIKTENTRALGAMVVPYDRKREKREAIADRIAAEKGAVVGPSFDDRHIVAGEGAVGGRIAGPTAGLGGGLAAGFPPCRRAGAPC